ncbi:TetR/AcrR family transcriptional regulator [Brachybacterium tyrofermentans]|uniref:TetR/AcrR family transcriptional regulator n=1 Tax=Brachybacterium tyrofermentans TaxID=47848 RepID=UPI003FD31B36
MPAWDTVADTMEKMRKAGRPRSFDTDEALHRALMVFWEHGYEGASMVLLQDATGLTAPQLYRAFDSKERLFERAVRLYQDQYGFAIRPDLPLIDAVTDYLDRAAHEFTTEPGRGCLVSTGLLATGRDAEAAATIVRAERDHALDSLRERIAAAVARDELPSGTDVSGLARTIGALIQGMSVQARDGADYQEIARIAASARNLLTAATAEP